jgi:hypothetical protein
MLASINERILVTPLALFTHRDLERVASLCGVPVLVVESKHTTTINLGSEH